MITGHSLGGALATFAAIDIKRKLDLSQRVVNFYSFGSPRTGNQAWSDYIQSLYPNGGYYRVSHYTDIVVQNPPRPFGYNHAGDEVWYLNNKGLQYKICPYKVGSVEDASCSDSYIFRNGIDPHLYYLDIPIAGMCKVSLAQDSY
jgi:hypothetical protein